MFSKKLTSALSAIMIVLFMAGQVAADVTISITNSYVNSNHESVRIGTITFDSSYDTGGETLTAANLNLYAIRHLDLESTSGYIYEHDTTSDTVIAYLPSGTPTVTNANESSHTHAVALDTGASAAGSSHDHALSGTTASGNGTTATESTHTHAVTLDTGVSGAEAAHTHAVTLDTGTSAAEAAHTHAVTLDGGSSAAGSSHNHAFTGTAISTDTFTVSHDATPETAALYVNTLDGVTGWLSCDNSADSATDYFETAGGERVQVIDDSAGATVALAQKYQLYFDEDAASADSRILFVNSISATDLYIPTESGKYIRLVHDAGAAGTGVALYFNDDGADATLRLNGTLPGTTNITTNATDDTYMAFNIVPAGTNAAEAAHTHGPGTLADAASGAGSSHTHGVGTYADAASAAGSSHTHGVGTYADAASGAGAAHDHGVGAHTHDVGTLDAAAEAAHTHGSGTLADAASGAGGAHTHVATVVGETADEVGAGTDLSTVVVKFKAIGY